MKNLNFRLLALVALVGMFALANAPRLANATGKTVVVTMTDEPPTYVPAKLTIEVGTTVEWKNTGTSLHDVTTDPSMAQNKSDVALPPGAKPFDSGFMPFIPPHTASVLASVDEKKPLEPTHGVRVLASGEVDESMLDALELYIQLQKKRLERDRKAGKQAE